MIAVKGRTDFARLKRRRFQLQLQDAALALDQTVSRFASLLFHCVFSAIAMKTAHFPGHNDPCIGADHLVKTLTGPDLIRDGERPKGWAPERDPFLLETNVPGIFAVGDVRHGSVKRVASGVGEGSVAVQFIHQYLSKV